MDISAELSAERAFLDRARTDLRRMRERTLSLEVQSADPVNAEVLARALHYRALALADDPGSSLFFGRIDLDSAQGDAAGLPTTLHIGRRHVSDAGGDPVVVDWRADVSTRFYRASHSVPMGLVRRRRFGIDHGELTAFEDEHLSDPTEGEQRSEILAAEIERPRTGPMRDIVATIQPEQDLLVRADAGTTVCIQGAPGTGKTAVGLHRAAWLLHAHRDRLSRSGVLVVGPNRAFLDHVGAVLPTLGEIQVGHTTIERLVSGDAAGGTDPVEVAALKGDPRMAEVLRRAVWRHVGRPSEALVVPRGVRKWRVPAYEVAEIVEELTTRGVRYESARQMLPQRLAHAVLLLMERAGDSPDDRVQDTVARSVPVRAYVRTAWPAVTPAAVVHAVLSDPTVLAECADGLLSDDEQRTLLWDKPARTPGRAVWSPADLVLLDEAGDLVSRTPSLGHVILDEAQDLSPMQLRAVGRRCSTGAATVLGDVAQGTTPWSTPSWATALEHLGKADGHVEELVRGFRVPAAVIEFAARLLPHMAPDLAPPESVRDNRGELSIQQVAASGVTGSVVTKVRSWLEVPGSIGIVVADASVDETSRSLTAVGIEHGVLGLDHGDVEHRVDVVPATVAQGLEFDRVLVVEPAAIADAEPDERTGLRRLYVVLTRAVSALTVVHAEALPAPLR
jgi:DNA helicase IV